VGDGVTRGPGMHDDAAEMSDWPVHGACKQPGEGGSMEQSSAWREIRLERDKNVSE
jgi:hypothetical protein